MIVEYVRYRMGAHQPEELTSAYREASQHLQDAPSCLGYELSHCVEDPALVTVRILWRSVDAHLQEFRSSPQFASFLQQVRPFIGEIEEMQHYEPSYVRWQRVD